MPKVKFYQRIIAAVIFLCLTSVSAAFCFDDDFGPVTGRIDGEHFNVYYTPKLDLAALNLQLNIRPSEEILGGKAGKDIKAMETEFADMLDTLFAQICDTLDMQLYSYQGNIKICRDYGHLNGIYTALFDKDLMNQRAFYVHELNTVYISPEGFTREILGREIARAVISHYFAVLPSEKIQEVLAGYVEYQLREPAASRN